MNIEHFIAKRLAFTGDKSFTKVIVQIAVVAIAISLSVMILTTSIISGFKNEITDKIFGFWGHIHITDSNVNRNFEVNPIPVNAAFYDEIREIAGVEYYEKPSFFGIELPGKEKVKESFGGVHGVYPYVIQPGLLSTKDNFHGILLKGVDENYNWEKLSRFIIDGEKIHYLKDSASADLVISRNIADKLKIETGDKVILSFIRDDTQIKKRFEVSGIYNTGLEEYDKRFCVADIAKIREILDWPPDETQGMEVVLDDVRDLDIMADYIYYDVVPQDYYAESIRSKFPSIFEWLKLQDVNEQIILGLMILVAIINMVTVLLILILERTRMIGILKSLGMNNAKIRKIFLWNAFYITSFGLVLGNILGLGIAFAQKYFKFIKLDEANYYLDTAPIAVNLWSVVLINVATLIITVIFMTLPTLLVTRITPVKALRFE